MATRNSIRVKPPQLSVITGASDGCTVTGVNSDRVKLNAIKSSSAGIFKVDGRNTTDVCPPLVDLIYFSRIIRRISLFKFVFDRMSSSGYGFTIAYTISKSIDDVSDAQGGFPNDGAAQQNPFNNRDNRAVSAFDLPQRLVITHTYESAQAFGTGLTWAMHRVACQKRSLPCAKLAPPPS